MTGGDMNSAARAAAAKAMDIMAHKNTGVQIIYSSHSSWPYASTKKKTLDIAVLDSSFNPPSMAHMALLSSTPLLAKDREYDGHLLLFSTQNADKGAGKEGDASLAQRATMMTLMAKDVEKKQTDQGQTANVAVGLVDKPLIFDKSTLTCQLLQHGQENQVAETRLHWVVGFDTLYRVFQLKYYPSESVFRAQCRQFFEKERTTLVCARRDPSSFPSLQAGEEQELLQNQYVKPWLEAGCIAMLDIDPSQAELSSTKIRSLLKDIDISDADKKHKLASLVPPSLVEYLVHERIYQ